MSYIPLQSSLSNVYQTQRDYIVDSILSDFNSHIVLFQKDFRFESAFMEAVPRRSNLGKVLNEVVVWQ